MSNTTAVTEINYKKPEYSRVNISCIRPGGWIKKQLEILANGLTGHLEEIWPDVGPDSGWLGGGGENWERGPYYLDGLYPLSVLTDSNELKAKLDKWIEWSLSSSSGEGFFGPAANTDWWPRFVMLKVMIQFTEHSGDERGLLLIERFFDFMEKNIAEKPFEMWAKSRAYEVFVSLFWLIERKPSAALFRLAGKILKQSVDWNSFFKDFTYEYPTSMYLSWDYYKEKMSEKDGADTNQPTFIDQKTYEELFYHYHYTHGVNIAMALKYPVFYNQLAGSTEPDPQLKEGWKRLMKYHGLANGLYSCDEHLNGRQPFQGTELCTVVEAMFSLEEIVRTTGDLWWGNILEEVAWNMLPAPISADGCSHQYNQQVNQVLCSVAPRAWYNNKDNSNIFGLEPHFGCCTANMHQGWPKLVSNSFLIKPGSVSGVRELLFVNYLPVSAELENTGGLSFQMKTDYPFDGKIAVEISGNSTKKIDVAFRIPEWARDFTISINSSDPSADSLLQDRQNYKLTFSGCVSGDIIEIDWKMRPRLVSEKPAGYSVRFGPLLFALPIGYEKNEIVKRGRFSDWELIPSSEWRYALTSLNPDDWEVVYSPCREGGFKSRPSPVRIKVRAIRILNWEMEKNSAGPVPENPVAASEPEQLLELVPYGCTELRISQFPAVKTI